ncbi:hypothetical protein GCM10029978_005540 [Actinoallomurus acanthiterrae]
MILFSLRRRPAAFAVAAALIVLRIAWRPAAGMCGSMTMPECLAMAAALVGAASLVAVAVRAGMLAAGASRALAVLPREPVPGPLADAARRAGIRRLVCLAGGEPSAFCAGPFRPRVYVTTGLADALGADELAAVLVHEQAHARRRDPLRRLLAHAATNVLIYLPLCGWWRRRQAEGAELRADQAAIERVGRRAVARALFALDGSGPRVPAGAAFEGAGKARVAQLLGDEVPRPRPPAGLIALSALGLVVATSLLMCVGQTLDAWLM